MQSERLKAHYERLWELVIINPEFNDQIDAAFEKAKLNMPRYVEVERQTKVPWQLISAIHMREASFNFNRHFVNGDPLNEVTTHIPKGRGPFDTWEESAIDAIKCVGFINVKSWDTPKMLEMAEKYNGLGYLLFHPACPSPYLWSMTSLYTIGKFGSDAVFNPGLKDKQVGIAALLLRFEEFDLLT